MGFKKDAEIIKELEPELERFQKKFIEYKNRIAIAMIGDDQPKYRVKERAVIKRAAQDLKEVLYKINKLSE